jgi:ATP-dependent DNA helicase RecQ
VLRGSKAKRIVENGHDKLSTWGLLKDEPEPQLRNWIDQLLSQGFLRQAGEYNCLEVTPAGRQLLKGQVTPTLLRLQVAESAQPLEDQWEGVDRDLFEELRGMRNRLAIQKQVPPYIIFSDATLRDLARQRPSNAAGLSRVHGIGAQKQKEFGAAVLHAIKEWCQSHNLAMNVEAASATVVRPVSSRSSRPSESTLTEYFDLFEQGLSIEDVANQLDRSVDTVSKYLGEYVKTHRVMDIDPWISPDVQRRVREAIGQVGCERLKPVFEQLESTVDYARIRIVATVWQLEQEDAGE